MKFNENLDSILKTTNERIGDYNKLIAEHYKAIELLERYKEEFTSSAALKMVDLKPGDKIIYDNVYYKDRICTVVDLTLRDILDGELCLVVGFSVPNGEVSMRFEECDLSKIKKLAEVEIL